MKRKIELIIIHCSATPSHLSLTPEALRQDHLKRGFSDAGYHYYILRNGRVVAMRPLQQIGAHTRGFNRESIGICYEGGVSPKGIPQDTRTPHQKEALLRLLGELREQFPKARIVGHRDLSPDRNHDGVLSPNEWVKACPSFDATLEYQSLNSPTI